MKILIIEDEVGIARILKRALSEAGYTPTIALDGQLAQETVEMQQFDLIILDLLIPGVEGGGVELCRNFRRLKIDIPILMLTALDSAKNKVTGLDAGADDYLTKPFNLVELLARVRALLRRRGRSEIMNLSVGDLELIPAKRQAKRGDRIIELTAKEFAVLDYLVRNAGRIVGQTELLEQAWDYEYDGMSNVVETYIRYLRKKLTEAGETDIIYTKRGSGYLIEAA